MMIPKYAKHFPMNEILKASELYNVGWELLSAIVQVESGGNQFAYRYEPKFNYLHDINILQNLWHTTAPTVEILQKSSYGITQIMGATAIDHGLLKLEEKFTTPTLLYRIDINLMFCCRILNRLFKLYGANDLNLIYACYNAGTAKKNSKGIYENQWAVDKFAKAYKEFIGESKIEMIDFKEI